MPSPNLNFGIGHRVWSCEGKLTSEQRGLHLAEALVMLLLLLVHALCYLATTTMVMLMLIIDAVRAYSCQPDAVMHA